MNFIKELYFLPSNFHFLIFFKGYIKPASKMWPTCGRVDDSYGDKNLTTKRADNL